MIFIQKFAITCRDGLWNKQMPYFSSVSDEWSRDLKSVQVQKQLSCRELSRNANQSATQNNGQTSRVKSLDEIVKMVRLLTVKVPNKSDGWEYFFSSGSDKHFKRDCPKNKEVDNKRLNENKVSTEGTEVVDGTVAARVDVLGKVIPRRAIEDKLSKLVKTSISVDGKLVHALLDSGTEITVIKKDLVPGISVEGASTIYLKGIFGPAVKCPLVYVPIGLATGGQVKVVHQQVLCALAEVLVEDVLLPPEVLDMLGGAQSEENSLAQSSQDLRVDSGNVDETEVSSGILPEKAQEHIEDSQRNITSCRNEVGTLGTKDEEVTAEMDKGIMHTRWGEAVALTSLSAKVACEAFVKLKELPCEVTSLATPDANLPFQVHCDASDYGVVCCLIQQDTEGIYRPIAFASQKFNATQKNWASIEKEAWAVLYGLNKFDKWIYGAKVEIISDHNSLKYLNQTTPKSPKLTRWALALQRWNHPITHRPGIQHRSADSLSRLR
ncbi:retrovirus-related Pol polyprotein from transposon opus [Trichonephila clavipes]|nr:retrovirus-related Pol polyprotein from transposon opus [Trichonephila clavipes]